MIQQSLMFTHLNATQLAQYHQDGYVALGRILDDQQLAGLRAAEARLRAVPMAHDGAKALTVFRHLVAAHEPMVREVGAWGSHIPLTQQLIGDNVVFWYTQFVTKRTDEGAGVGTGAGTAAATFPWHQDNGYASVEPCTNVTVWVALDDVDECNGCVWVMPGSHLNGILPHANATPDSWHLSVQVEGNGIPAILKAGEAIAFHGNTLHRSLANHTTSVRRGFFMQYADANAVHQIDKKPLVERPHAWVVAGRATYPTAG